MKNGKRLERRHKELLKKQRLNPENWFFVKDTPNELHLVNRQTGVERVLKVMAGD